MLLRKMDLDRDGRISFRDYRETVRANILLLQPFGKCLPDREDCYNFMTTFTTKVTTEHFRFLEPFTASEIELKAYQRRKFSVG